MRIRMHVPSSTVHANGASDYCERLRPEDAAVTVGPGIYNCLNPDDCMSYCSSTLTSTLTLLGACSVAHVLSSLT